MIFTRTSILLLMSVVLSACGSKLTDDRTQVPNLDKVDTSSKEEIQTNESIKEIAAKVNGSEITQPQLEYAMGRLLSKNIKNVERNKLSGKVLDSLIGSRLMAIMEEAKLDEQEHEILRIKVSAYREELLVKKYIIENIEPLPVTQESVYQYYIEHQNDFGADIEKTFEIIQSRRGLKETERAVLLGELSNISKVDDWSSWYINNKQLGVSYKKTVSLVKLLKEPLKKIVESTKEGKTSPLLNEKIITIVRVKKSNKINALPFEQVSGKIRRMMAPQALKMSIKDHLTKLKKNASIKKYLSKGDNNKVDFDIKRKTAGIRE